MSGTPVSLGISWPLSKPIALGWPVGATEEDMGPGCCGQGFLKEQDYEAEPPPGGQFLPLEAGQSSHHLWQALTELVFIKPQTLLFIG